MFDDYLTYEEFKALGGTLADADFKEYLAPAVTALQPITNDYSPEGDKWPYRARHYRQALTYQITYFSGLQATTAGQIGSRPTSQSIGDTSVSYGTAGLTNKAGGVATIAAEVYDILAPTGLLYRGRTICRRCR